MSENREEIIEEILADLRYDEEKESLIRRFAAKTPTHLLRDLIAVKDQLLGGYDDPPHERTTSSVTLGYIVGSVNKKTGEGSGTVPMTVEDPNTLLEKYRKHLRNVFDVNGWDTEDWFVYVKNAHRTIVVEAPLV